VLRSKEQAFEEGTERSRHDWRSGTIIYQTKKAEGRACVETQKIQKSAIGSSAWPLLQVRMRQPTKDKKENNNSTQTKKRKRLKK